MKDKFLNRNKDSILAVQNEISILKMLDHSGIIKVLDYGDNGQVAKVSGRQIT